LPCSRELGNALEDNNGGKLWDLKKGVLSSYRWKVYLDRVGGKVPDNHLNLFEGETGKRREAQKVLVVITQAWKE